MSLTTYNFLWGMVKFILPSYLERRQKKGKEDIHRINERFGISKNNRPYGTLVWLHGTSVGESVAALALANSMSKNGYGTNKKEFFLLTTNTLSAAKLIKDKIKKGLPAIHQYHPYDHPEFVSNFLGHWKPNMAVFLESDFWPNLIYLTANTKIPTVLASSQMSDKSARFWTGLGFFLAKKIFGKVTDVLAVDPKQEALFKKLGAKNVKSLTSLKSIAEKPPVNQNYIINLKKNLLKKKVILASSTHPGEEELMIKLADLLRKNAQDNIDLEKREKELNTALSKLSAAEEAVEGEMTCMECLQIFDNPCILQTGETYCAKCVETIKNEKKVEYTIPNKQIATLAGKFVFMKQSIAAIKAMQQEAK